MGLDRRIGPKFLHAGLGYGGSCLPKDMSSLIYVASSCGYKPLILKAVNEVNRSLVAKAVQKLKLEIDELKNTTVGLLGLSFKPNTDDLREAPALRIIEELLEEGANVKVFDPVAMDNLKAHSDVKVEFCKNPYETAEDSDALMLVTEWNEFRELDLARIKKLMRKPVFIDCRNVYKKALMAEHGFRYQSFGRGA